MRNTPQSHLIINHKLYLREKYKPFHMSTMRYLKKLIRVVILLCTYRDIFAYEEICPKPPDDLNYRCSSIKDWKDFAHAITQSGLAGVVLCPFNINKPPTAKALILSKPKTIVCLEAGTCIINTSTMEEKGIIKIRGRAKVAVYGLVFRFEEAMFNQFSAVHIAFATSMKQGEYRKIY